MWQGVLGHDEVSTALCGVRNIEQLQSTVDAVGKLPDQNLIDKCFDIASEEGVVRDA